MDQRSTRALWSAGRTAAYLGAAHAGLTLWIVGKPQNGPGPLFAAPGALLVEPALLLLGQVTVLAGFLYLAVTLRGVARSMTRSVASGGPNAAARGESDPPGPNQSAPAQLIAPTVAALLFGICYASGLWAAARGLVGPIWLAGLLLAPASLFFLFGPSAPTAGHRLNPLQREQWVSRLRGASILVAVTCVAVTAVTGSLVGGALLPTAILRHLPSGPPPSPDQWAVPPPSAQPEFAPLPVSATAAGEAIHSLFFAGSPRGPQPLERAPARRYQGWWALESPPSLPAPPHEWAARLFSMARGGGLLPEDVTFLRMQSLHPANAEFDRLAGVPTADIAGARWRSLDEHPVAAFELPVPRYVELWNGVRGRIAGATYLALQGDPDEARRRLETVAHLGRLLNQDGPLTLDAMLGAKIAQEAALAAQSLAGPSLRTTGVATTAPLRAPRSPPTTEERLGWLQDYETALATPDAPRGVRWEAFTLVNSFLPCGSPAATLWGPSPELLEWRTAMGTTLSSRPSEEQMARVLSEGYLGTRAGGEGWGWLPKVLSLTLADRPAVTHCAPLVAAVMGLY